MIKDKQRGKLKRKSKHLRKYLGEKPSLEEVKNSQLEYRLKDNKQEERIKFEMFKVGKVNKEGS